MANPVFLARRLNIVAEIIEDQGDQLLLDCGLGIPSRLFSLLLLIFKLQPVNAAELAKTLQRSHQLVAHRLKSLAQLKMIRYEPDPMDERKVQIHLTQSGVETATKFANIAEQLVPIFDNLYTEVNIDVIAVLDRLEAALEKKTISQRFKEWNASTCTTATESIR